jgi:hypothetical protein
MSSDRAAELRQQAEELARHCLVNAGFDFAAPSPRTAWKAFKAFAAAPLTEPPTASIGYEAYQASDRDRVLWLSFVRNVETTDGVGWHVGYVLSCPAPSALVGVHDSNWWWPEHLTLQAWFAEVENNDVLRDCMAADGWRWEGFSD